MPASTLVLKRQNAFIDWLRSYRVMLDGKEVARIRNGQQIELPIEPGPHRLVLQIDWCASNAIEFEQQSGATIFDCGNRHRGWRLFQGVGKAVGLGSGDYLWLRRQD